MGPRPTQGDEHGWVFDRRLVVPWPLPGSACHWRSRLSFLFTQRATEPREGLVAATEVICTQQPASLESLTRAPARSSV